MRGIIQKSPSQKSWALTGSETLISQCSWQERVICLILHIFPAMGIFLTYLIKIRVLHQRLSGRHLRRGMVM